MKLYERIENNNFDEIDRNRAMELIEGGNGHLVYNENYFKLQKENEELKDFKKQVTDIESTNFIKYKNYIAIQKIKDKIKELEEMKVDGEVFTTSVDFAILILQELIEEREKN